MRVRLRDEVLGGFPARSPLEWQPRTIPMAGEREIMLTTEFGVRSRGVLTGAWENRRGTAIVIGMESEGSDAIARGEFGSNALAQESRRGAGGVLKLPHPRGTRGPQTELMPVAGVIDHSVAEWALWVGRPLLGQWVWDILRWLDFLDEYATAVAKTAGGSAASVRPYTLASAGPMSVPAMVAAALDTRIESVACRGGLVSYVARLTKPWAGLPMGLAVPNIFDVGDIGQLAALIAPRPLRVEGGVEPDGDAATGDRLSESFRFTADVYRLLGAAENLRITPAAAASSSRS